MSGAAVSKLLSCECAQPGRAEESGARSSYVELTRLSCVSGLPRLVLLFVVVILDRPYVYDICCP